jgi:hypothetical protein
MITPSIPLRRRLFYLFSALRYQWEGVLDRFGLYRGAAPTPHAVKRRVIRRLAAGYGAKYFVETGTYMGDMTAAMLPWFERLYSIEMSVPFYEKAAARFARYGKVRVLQGDSAVEIGRVIPMCDQRTLFWLDAHWSGGSTARGDVDTPIVSELAEIFRGSLVDPVVLVDDARCFTGAGGYPTIEELRALVAQWRTDYEVALERDIIRIVPRSPR